MWTPAVVNKYYIMSSMFATLLIFLERLNLKRSIMSCHSCQHFHWYLLNRTNFTKGYEKRWPFLMIQSLQKFISYSNVTVKYGKFIHYKRQDVDNLVIIVTTFPGRQATHSEGPNWGRKWGKMGENNNRKCFSLAPSEVNCGATPLIIVPKSVLFTHILHVFNTFIHYFHVQMCSSVAGWSKCPFMSQDVFRPTEEANLHFRQVLRIWSQECLTT